MSSVGTNYTCVFRNVVKEQSIQSMFYLKRLKHFDIVKISLLVMHNAPQVLFYLFVYLCIWLNSLNTLLKLKISAYFKLKIKHVESCCSSYNGVIIGESVFKSLSGQPAKYHIWVSQSNNSGVKIQNSLHNNMTFLQRSYGGKSVSNLSKRTDSFLLHPWPRSKSKTTC